MPLGYIRAIEYVKHPWRCVRSQWTTASSHAVTSSRVARGFQASGTVSEVSVSGQRARTRISLLTTGSSSGSVRRLANTAVSASSSGCSGAALNTADRLPRNSACGPSVAASRASSRHVLAPFAARSAAESARPRISDGSE